MAINGYFVGIKIWTWTKSKQKDDKSGLAFNLLQISIKKVSLFVKKSCQSKINIFTNSWPDSTNSIPPLTEYQYTCFYKGSGSNFGGIFLLKIKWKYLQFSLHFLLIYSPYPMSLVGHQFESVEFRTFVLIFSTALVCRKQQYSKFDTSKSMSYQGRKY